MGNKRDALFGRRAFKASKFKPPVNLTISRLTILKNQRQVRFKQARSDVLQLLQLGYRERPLLCAEHVVKEQNLLDVYDKIEGSLNLFVERVHLIEEERFGDSILSSFVSSLRNLKESSLRNLKEASSGFNGGEMGLCRVSRETRWLTRVHNRRAHNLKQTDVSPLAFLDLL